MGLGTRLIQNAIIDYGKMAYEIAQSLRLQDFLGLVIDDWKRKCNPVPMTLCVDLWSTRLYIYIYIYYSCYTSCEQSSESRD